MALTQDQMVEIAKKIREKTASAEEAAEFLKSLSNLLKEMHQILEDAK